MKKRLLALLMVTVLGAGLLTACGGTGAVSSETSQEQTATAAVEETAGPTGISDETLVVALPSEPATIVPVVANLDNRGATVARCIYEPLLHTVRETAEVQEDSLCTIDIVDDMHLRINIREGVKFHNGAELNADQVMYMFSQGVLGPAAADRYFVYDYENFVKEDDYHVLVALTQPWAQAIDLMSLAQFIIPEMSVLEAAGGVDTMQQYLENAGTGKYKFKEWVTGEYILVERNDDYWNQDALPYYKEIKFVFITDGSARGMAVQSGDVDVALDLDIANYEIYNADPTVEAKVLNSGNMNILFLNCGEGYACNDERVRQAISLLLNRDDLRIAANAGFGELGDTCISPISPMWDGKTPEADSVDVEAAKALLAEAGYPDGLKLRMRTMAANVQQDMIIEELRQGGIEVEYVIAEPAVHFWQGLGIGDYDMHVSAQQCIYYSEPVRCSDGIQYTYSDTMGGCMYAAEDFHEICTRCLTTMDMTERKAAYAELQQYYRDHYLSYGFYSNVALEVAKSGIEGIKVAGVGEYEVFDAYQK